MKRKYQINEYNTAISSNRFFTFILILEFQVLIYNGAHEKKCLDSDYFTKCNLMREGAIFKIKSRFS